MSQQALARGWRCCSPLADVRVPDHLQTHRLGLGRCCYRVKGAATAVAVETAGLPRGCRTNQHHPRLLVRLPQGHDFGESHFGRGEPRPAGWVALTRSAEMAVVKFVQGGLVCPTASVRSISRSRSERTFACRVRLLARGRGPEQTPVSRRVLGLPTANPRPASPGACSGTQRRQAAASRSVSLARESGHLGSADSSTAGRRRGGSGQRRRGNCRSAPSDIRPARISERGKYESASRSPQKPARRPRDSDRWHARASPRSAADRCQVWGQRRCLRQHRGSAESRGSTGADARRARLTVGRHGRSSIALKCSSCDPRN